MRPPAFFVLLLVPTVSALTTAPSCLDATEGDVVVLPAARFEPLCVLIDAGERVRWTNVAGAAEAVGDVETDGACFLVAMALAHRASVELGWDADADALVVRTWNDDGEPSAPRACDPDADHDGPDGTRLVVYRSFATPDAGTGKILVRV